ncbi:reverse transcriptase domain-containing protein [Tanacetum coccineum]
MGGMDNGDSNVKCVDDEVLSNGCNNESEENRENVNSVDDEDFPVKMPPKRTSTSAAPTMTEAAIRQLITDGVTAALEAQAAAMANADNPNRTKRNSCSKKRKLQRIHKLSTFLLQCNCAEENRVTFATGTLTDDALSWWNAYAQPIGIEQANRIAWTELKRLLTNKYCPRTEIKKMEDEFYGLTVNGSDLKTYIRRFQELAVLCPNMVPNTEKLMEAFIGGLPQSIEGNVTASKPQTLEEATNIAHRLMDQIIKRNSVQETNDHKRKFDDKRNTTNNNNYPNNSNNNNYSNNRNNNNYPNDRNNNNHSNNRNNNNYPDNRNNNSRNNDHHQQQNGSQETFKANGNHGYNGPHPLCRKYCNNGYEDNRVNPKGVDVSKDAVKQSVKDQTVIVVEKEDNEKLAKSGPESVGNGDVRNGCLKNDSVVDEKNVSYVKAALAKKNDVSRNFIEKPTEVDEDGNEYMTVYELSLATSGISALASRLGKPLVMDNVTAEICKTGVGRLRYARVLVEVPVTKCIPGEIEVVFRDKDKVEVSRKKANIKFDWIPPRCSNCCVFGHELKTCGKIDSEVAFKIDFEKANGQAKVKENEGDGIRNDEFIEVKHKKDFGMRIKQQQRPSKQPHKQGMFGQKEKLVSQFIFQKKNMEVQVGLALGLELASRLSLGLRLEL